MRVEASAAAEYRAVRESVGVLSRDDIGVVEVTGRDRVSFLHALVSNDLKSRAPGGGCSAALLDVHGKVRLLLVAWLLDDRVLLLTPPGAGAATVEALDHYLFAEKVALEDATGTWSFVTLAGPAADDVAKRLTGAVPPAEPWAHVAGTLDATGVRVARGEGETGEPEIWIAAPASAGDALHKAVLDTGAPLVGETARESLRIEAGTPRFGVDVDGSVLLPEIPTAHLVSHTKGCYPGQEVVVRIRDRGHVNRRLRGLALDGDTIPARGAVIEADAAAVGTMTSATWSIGLHRAIALGFVRRQHADAGTRVAVRAGDAAVPATVSDLPFAR